MKIDNHAEFWRGKKFGRLTVIGFEHVPTSRGSTAWYWICRCDCGTIISAQPSRIRSGHTASCGCYKRDQTIAYNQTAKKKHGGRKDRLYYIWRGMKSRCCCPTNKNYERWGGRGISVCDEWVDDYAAFKAWALSNGYTDSLSIDRIDVNGNYCPENCRWATQIEQQRNKSNSKAIEYNGKMWSVVDLSDEFGIEYGTLYSRIFKYGWDIDRALTEKVCSGPHRSAAI